MAADVGEEELQAVGRARQARSPRSATSSSAFSARRRSAPRRPLWRAISSPIALELARQLLDLVRRPARARARTPRARPARCSRAPRAASTRARAFGLEQFRAAGSGSSTFTLLSSVLSDLAAGFARYDDSFSLSRANRLGTSGILRPRPLQTSNGPAAWSFRCCCLGLCRFAVRASGRGSRTRPSPPRSGRVVPETVCRARDRKPESTSRVLPSSISWRAISGVSVRPATRFQITKPQPASSRLFQLVQP